VNAEPLLKQIVVALDECRLDAILIGNAAAALQGAPVTTVDFDFMFRKTPTNLRKLKCVATALGCQIWRSYYPASCLYRVVDDERGLRIDFMSVVRGIKFFESLRARASRVEFGERPLDVAGLDNVGAGS